MNNDFHIIKERMKQLALATPAKENYKELIKEYRALTVPSPLEMGGYRFSDVDYTLTHNEFWPVSHLISRIGNLIYALKVASADEKAEMMDLIKGHLTDLAYGEYKNDNWWQGDIGLPVNLSLFLIILDGELPEELRTALIKLLDKGSVKCRPEILTVKNAYHTGANLAWYCSTSMRRAALLSDPEEIKMVVDNMANETVPGAYEGPQEDGSYFQHHRRIYTLGYGSAFISDATRIFSLVKDTSLACPQYALDNLANLLLDGVRHLIGGCGGDYLTRGREISRGLDYNMKSWIKVIDELLNCGTITREAELRQFRAELESGKTPDVPNRYFPVSKYLTMHTGDLYVSFKGSDPTLYQAECNKDENYLAVNLSYGTACCIMRYGNEYSNFFNVSDFNYFPGVTCRTESDEVLLNRAYEGRAEGFTWYKVDTEDFGGAQSDDIAACFIGAENYGINAVVSAFATPYGMVLLGTDLKESNGEPIHTTVNHCHAVGDVTLKENGNLVIHNGIAYRNLDANAPFKASVAHREYDYNRNYFSNGKPYHVEAEAFTLEIPTDQSYGKYAYMILPEEISEKTVKVLVNNSDAQGIQIEDGRKIIVFHKQCTIELDCGKKISGKACEVVFA